MPLGSSRESCCGDGHSLFLFLFSLPTATAQPTHGPGHSQEAMGRACNFVKQEWASLKTKRCNIQGCVPAKVPVIQLDFHFEGKTQPVSLNLCDNIRKNYPSIVPSDPILPQVHWTRLQHLVQEDCYFVNSKSRTMKHWMSPGSVQNGEN